MDDTTIKEDDDEIIDLTDLLEEGDGLEDEKGEGSEKGPEIDKSSISQEPETFDLGKEITMEDDVSVEDIESVNENFDIDVSLSSNEEAALKEAEVKEAAVPEEPQTFEEADQSEESKAGPEPDNTKAIFEDNIELAEPSAEHAEESFDKVAETEVAEETQPQIPLDELKQEIPAMLEGIVRPIMGELVHELIDVTRDMLPGIVEKVIREEIEKLKKID